MIPLADIDEYDGIWKVEPIERSSNGDLESNEQMNERRVPE
ncbi:MAG TPA: hypothetical protein VF094_06070 [Gaiellaceae bacterium]